MRRLIVLPLVLTGFMFSTITLAAPTQIAHQSNRLPTKPSQAHSEKTKSIMLYAQPNKKQLVQQLPAYSRLVVILHQGDWVKVGNPQDGTVGWVNIDQWRHARQPSLQWSSDMQSLSINKQGDKLTVYKNGKKLSDKEAKKVYHHWQADQLKQQRVMQHYFRDFDRKMYWDMRHMHDMTDEPMWMPGPVIQPAEEHPHSSNKKKISV